VIPSILITSISGTNFAIVDSMFDSKKNNAWIVPLLTWSMLLLALSFVIVSWVSQGIVWTMLQTDLTPSMKLEEIKIFFESFGKLAPLAYVGCVMVEVLVAPIPGIMLYAPGGVVFGGFLGGCLSLIGNTLGAGIACAVARSIGESWATKYFASEKLRTTQDMLAKKGFWLILLLRINPLTSSDLISYAAGLTRIPVWQVMLATASGMAPLCFAQAYLAENLMQRFPWLLYPLLLCLILYVGIVVKIVFRMRKQPT
jgi:uncharacterized membrane protein YdjX (TVP38/TMEM64 family)